LERAVNSHEEERALLLNGIKRHPEFRALIAAIDTLPPDQRSMARRRLGDFLEGQIQAGHVRSLLGFGLAAIRALVDIPEIARDAQASALLKEPSAADVRPGLGGLGWRVRRTKKPTYILGDIGLVACRMASAELPDPLKVAGEFQGLYLPISSTALLVADIANSPSACDETVNVASAELSRDFFVAASCGARESEYQKILGRRAIAVSESMMADGIEHIRRELRSQE
jgi:hypothetical protein